MGMLQNSNAIETGGYAISNSLRFQSASSQYLSRTLTTPTNNKIWTWSAWVKRGRLSVANINLLGCYDGSSANSAYLAFNSNDTLTFQYGGAAANSGTTTAVYRDTAAWYHIVWSVNATTGTSTLYINGTSIASASIANVASQINSAISHNIGQLYSSLWFFDGYMTEINLIDGQALTPSSFGTTDTTTGQWVAKKYAGSYGTNGFYLPFSNGTSTTTLGADSSGNGNNWTLTNFTRSAGVSDCWMYDVPSGNSGVSGTQPSSNYAVMNPLGKASTANVTNSNLNFTNTTLGNYPAVGSTIFVSTGKWYFEGIFTGGGTSEATIGLSTANNFTSNSFQTATSGTTYWNSAQGISKNGTYLSATPTFTYNDVIGVAFDADAGTVTYYKNNVAQTPVVTGITGIYAPTFGIQYYNAGQWNANFGQRSFAYTPPSGFKALCTANLPAATIQKGNQYMDAITWTGNNSTGGRSITGLGFSPDIVWAKNRSAIVSNVIYDTIRGAGANAELVSNSTGAEGSSNNDVYDYLSSFDSNGFSSTWSGSNTTLYFNYLNHAFVGWCWDAGSSTVTNTNGTISSQVRANPTAGVSVVTYTGTGANATIGHGLGVAPKMVIVKQRNAATNWTIYHNSIGAGNALIFTTSAQLASNDWWNSTNPTSSVFTVGVNSGVNANTGTYVAYCFSEIAGFSKFGSYTGNGSADGAFVYLGFRPKFFMVKRTDSVESWITVDTVRDSYNPEQAWLYPNLSNAEATGTSLGDALSNGFKLRSTTSGGNISGATYIYMAFAENPFANANAR